MRYDLDMEKNGRTKGLPEGDYPPKIEAYRKGCGGNSDEPWCMSEWWQRDTVREVRAKQWVLVLIMLTKIIKDQCLWISRDSFIVGIISFIFPAVSEEILFIYSGIYSIMDKYNLLANTEIPYSLLVNYIHENYIWGERKREDPPDTHIVGLGSFCQKI